MLLAELLDSRFILDSSAKSMTRGLSSCNPSLSIKTKKIPLFSFFQLFLHKHSISWSILHMFHYYSLLLSACFCGKFRTFLISGKSFTIFMHTRDKFRCITRTLLTLPVFIFFIFEGLRSFNLFLRHVR